MRNGRKNRNSKAWSALERKKKKKKRKNPGEVSDGHESALDAFFWDSDCSETSGVDRDRLRNEPIHPPRPRECSSNRPSTTLESGNLIIHIESMRGIKTQRFCGKEFGFLIFMDGVSFFFFFTVPRKKFFVERRFRSLQIEEVGKNSKIDWFKENKKERRDNFRDGFNFRKRRDEGRKIIKNPP